MATQKHKSVIYWILKVLSIIVSCLFPIVVICEKFPVWTQTYGTGRSIGTGGLLIAVVLLVIFRRTVFDFFKEKLKLKHTPPLVVWIVMIIIAYALLGLCKFLTDIILVLWFGLLGCGLGSILTLVAEVFFTKREEGNEGT